MAKWNSFGLEETKFREHCSILFRQKKIEFSSSLVTFVAQRDMKQHDIALLSGIIVIKILSGTAMGLFGPMLPSLAKNTNVGK